MRARDIVWISVAIVALVMRLDAGAGAQAQTRQDASVAGSSSSSPAPAGGAIGSIDVVSAEQIAATGAADILAALALVPTLVIDDTGGPSGAVTLSVRGSNSRQVLVLVDGRRASGTPAAPFNINDLGLSVERIARIEVIPAPASVIYGPDAIGGVVNIVTRPAGTTSGFALSYGRGTDADQRIAGGVQLGLKKMGLRLDGQLLTGDGFRDNGDFDAKSFSVGLAVAPAPWGLDVRWTSLNRETGVPGPVAYPSPEARQKVARDGLRADVVYQPGSSWDFKVGAFTRSESLRFTDPAPPVIDPLVPSDAISDKHSYRSRGVEARLDFSNTNSEFYTVGGEWGDDGVKSEGEEDRTAERWSLYAQDQWRNGNWSAVGAIRRDDHSEFGGRTNPSLSVGWGSGGWKVWAAWARNSRVPSFEELYGDEQFRKGNPDLERETSAGYDGGIEMGGGTGRVRLTAFRRSVDNLIRWADTDGDFVYRPENVSQATVSGWEAEVTYRPSASIEIPVGYQRLSTEDDETHESLPGAVHSLWRAAIQGTGKSFTWSLEYAVTDRGDYQRRDETWKYTVINAALAWRTKIASLPVQAGLRLENLQDRDYETMEGYPMRGRSWFAEVKVRL